MRFTKKAFPLVISNFNSSKITRHTQKILEKKLYEHCLIVIKNQSIKPTKLLHLAKIFGTPYRSLSKYPLNKNPLISLLSNRQVNGKPTGNIVQPRLWHSDSFMKDNPDKVTLLYCVEAPVSGGETLFINTEDAYDSLAKSIIDKISGKKIIIKHIDLNKPALKHPIVRINPVTKRKSLFITLNNALGIEGYTEKAGLKIIQDLYEHTINTSPIYTHKWEKNDIVAWYNPSTLHAVSSLTKDSRTIWRIITEGEFPVQ